MKLKFFTLFTFTLLFINLAFCQESKDNDSFEGTIIYKITYKDKEGGVSKKEATERMGKQQIYSIKRDKYKSEMQGNLKITQWYRNDTIFTRVNDVKGLYYTKTTESDDEILSYTIKKNAKKVLGIPCDLLTINSSQGKTKYYFNSDYSVKLEDYPNHLEGYWTFCIEKTGALPLMTISNLKNINMKNEAVEIKRINLDDELFKVPNYPIAKMPK